MSYTKTMMETGDANNGRHHEDRMIDKARLSVAAESTNFLGATITSYEEVHQDPDWYFEPTIEQRKAALVEDVKKIAPDWDQMTTRELLHLMAAGKVVFVVDDKPWLKTGGDA